MSTECRYEVPPKMCRLCVLNDIHLSVQIDFPGGRALSLKEDDTEFSKFTSLMNISLRMTRICCFQVIKDLVSELLIFEK